MGVEPSSPEIDAQVFLVLAPPIDTPRFRTAVLADPQGAAFSVSQFA